MQSPLPDDFARLMTDAAGVAQGMRKEAEQAMAGLLERWLAEQEIPSRDEVEALRETVCALHEKNAELEARVAKLEQLAADNAAGTERRPTADDGDVDPGPGNSQSIPNPAPDDN